MKKKTSRNRLVTPQTLARAVGKANELVVRIVDQDLDINLDSLKALNNVEEWYRKQGGLTLRQIDFVYRLEGEVRLQEEERADRMELEGRLTDDFEF